MKKQKEELREVKLDERYQCKKKLEKASILQ